MARTSTGESEDRTNSVWREWGPIASLAAIWLAAVFLVDPRGDFPVLDDWSYGRTVKILLEQGKLQYDGWNAPTLFFQVLYGALFCLPFGFSFEALRISTLVAGLAAGLGTYLLLREASATRLVAMVGSLVVMLNPSYFQHAFTFMTDVPFTALAVVSALCFLRALRKETTGIVVLGTVFASCATLIRQPGIFIAVGYGLALLASRTVDKGLLLRSAIPAAATLAAYVVYDRVIDYLQIKPILLGTFLDLPLMRLKTQGMLPVILDAIRRAEALFAHLSLFVLPCLLLLLGYELRQNRRRPTVRRVLLAVSPALLLLVYWRFWPPQLPLQVFGTAHLVMLGQSAWGPSGEHFGFRPALWSAEFAATAMVIFLLVAVIVGIAHSREFECRFDCAAALFGMSTSAMLVTPFFGGHFFERYLIPVVPFALLALVALSNTLARVQSNPEFPRQVDGSKLNFAQPSGKLRLSIYTGCSPRGWQFLATAGGIAVLMAFSTISILFAHDYMAWNRLRWQAVNYLIHDRDVAPNKIDAGLPVSGWYLFPVDGPIRTRYSNPLKLEDWWHNEAAEYIVALSDPTRLESLMGEAQRSPSEQLDVVWKMSFTGWLPGADGDVLVCRGPKCREILGVRR